MLSVYECWTRCVMHQMSENKYLSSSFFFFVDLRADVDLLAACNLGILVGTGVLTDLAGNKGSNTVTLTY